MHTVWVRLNAVVFFGLSALLGFSVLAAFVKIGHSNTYKPGKSFGIIFKPFSLLR
jgi:signal peptidase complex subunit 3